MRYPVLRKSGIQNPLPDRLHHERGHLPVPEGWLTFVIGPRRRFRDVQVRVRLRGMGYFRRHDPSDLRTGSRFNPRFQGFSCEEGYIHEKMVVGVVPRLPLRGGTVNFLIQRLWLQRHLLLEWLGSIFPRGGCERAAR
jgi:hypothetical protein